MWYEEAVFYQIYPLGFCGAPAMQDDVLKSRIHKVKDWIPHMKKLGINAVYFCPVFQSDEHGYDTRDYLLIDKRLGTNQDFQEVVRALHDGGIRVILDGVFNHVGRGFWAFQDVKKNRQASVYKDWFCINWDGDSVYQDGFWYEGWEGYFNLVKLNLDNPEVRTYLCDCAGRWMDEFRIDGIRLDVAYCLNHDFIRQLRQYTLGKREDFFLLGEMLHGDYKTIVNPEMLHSATNYECYKGIYSSFNSMNMFEIAYSLNRQFGPDPWALYTGMHLWSFADNHDVDRIASILQRREQLIPLYGLVIGMPGIPCLYYGSEWGAEGRKENGSDAAIRASYEQPEWNVLTEQIAAMLQVRKENPAFAYGTYRQAFLTNRQFAFERQTDSERIYVVINADEQAFSADFPVEGGNHACNLLTGEEKEAASVRQMPPYSVSYWKITK